MSDSDIPTLGSILSQALNARGMRAKDESLVDYLKRSATEAKLDGKHGWAAAMVEAADALSPHQTAPVRDKVSINDVNIGDVVCEMHGHVTNFGVFKGYYVTNVFEISEKMFQVMRASIPGTEDTRRPAISNKFAQLVSFTEDYSDNTVKTALVIYLYDFQYYAATLHVSNA